MVSHQSTRNVTIKEVLDQSLDAFSPEIRSEIYMYLSTKHGIDLTAENNYDLHADKIEYALFRLFESGSRPLIREFRRILDEQAP
jgi:hypothetical protein